MFILNSNLVEPPGCFCGNHTGEAVDRHVSLGEATLACKAPSPLALGTHEIRPPLRVGRYHHLPPPQSAFIQWSSSHVSGAVLGAGDTEESTVIILESSGP